MSLIVEIYIKTVLLFPEPKPEDSQKEEKLYYKKKVQALKLLALKIAAHGILARLIIFSRLSYHTRELQEYHRSDFAFEQLI